MGQDCEEWREKKDKVLVRVSTIVIHTMTKNNLGKKGLI